MKLSIAGSPKETETALFLAEKAGFSVIPEADAELNFPVLEKLTVSKLKTCAFLRENGFPVPEEFPRGSEPYIVRPDSDSGSRGIWVTEDFAEAAGAVNCGFLVQEFLAGPVLCVQVTGVPGHYKAYPVLRLEMNGRYIAESASILDDSDLAGTAVLIAQKLGLRGYLCVKAVDGRIISLDDRLQGLAPLALFRLTGDNVLADAVDCIST